MNKEYMKKTTHSKVQNGNSLHSSATAFALAAVQLKKTKNEENPLRKSSRFVPHPLLFLPATQIPPTTQK